MNPLKQLTKEKECQKLLSNRLLVLHLNAQERTGMDIGAGGN